MCGSFFACINSQKMLHLAGLIITLLAIYLLASENIFPAERALLTLIAGFCAALTLLNSYLEKRIASLEQQRGKTGL